MKTAYETTIKKCKFDCAFKIVYKKGETLTPSRYWVRVRENSWWCVEKNGKRANSGEAGPDLILGWLFFRQLELVDEKIPFDEAWWG